MNIKPVSTLRNYKEVLDDISPQKPVFLTKNGYGKYAVIDLADYERFSLGLELYEMIQKAEKEPTKSLADIKKELLHD